MGHRHFNPPVPERRLPRGWSSDLGITALAFVVLEAATRIVPLLTSLLSILPVLGVGTAVDVGILVAGLAVAGYRGRNARPPAHDASER